MGADDENVGPGTMECPGHDWLPVLSGWHLQGLRLVREYRCRWCDAVTIMQRGEYVKLPLPGEGE